MGSPGYYPDMTSTVSGEVMFYLKWTSQAAGALPAAAFPGTPATGWAQSGGGRVLSVVHGGTGIYTVTLTEAWSDSLDVHGYCIQKAAFSAAGVCDVQVTADNSTVAGTQTVLILCTNAAGAAVEPAVNDQIVLSFKMQSYNAN